MKILSSAALTERMNEMLLLFHKIFDECAFHRIIYAIIKKCFPICTQRTKRGFDENLDDGARSCLALELTAGSIVRAHSP
jgi:hypothetical protein